MNGHQINTPIVQLQQLAQELYEKADELECLKDLMDISSIQQSLRDQALSALQKSVDYDDLLDQYI